VGVLRHPGHSRPGQHAASTRHVAHRLMAPGGRPRPHSPPSSRRKAAMRTSRGPTRSFSPPARGRFLDARRSERLARGVEVGRQSGADRAARRRRVPLVARGRADHGQVPRISPGSGRRFRKDRARRRGAGVLLRSADAFSVLQRRIGRRSSREDPGDAPAAFMAYDVLELGGTTCGRCPCASVARAGRPGAGAQRIGSCLSPAVEAATWEDLLELRKASPERGVEGLMLKRWLSPYRHGRRGRLVEVEDRALRIDAVLVYAQPGHAGAPP